jgi:hypothetical protein
MMSKEPNELTAESSAGTATWILAASPAAFSVVALLLVGFGYLWSQVFDTRGHELAAVALLPASLTACVFSILIFAALRKTGRCRRLALVGLSLTLLTTLGLVLLLGTGL